MSFRHRGRVVLTWVATLALAIGLSGAFGGDFTADYSAPGSDSSQAQQLLEERFTARAGDSVDVVVVAEQGADDPAVRADVAALLTELGKVRHVSEVEDPYVVPGGISSDRSPAARSA